MILNIFTYAHHLVAITSKSILLTWNLAQLTTLDSIPKISSPLGISMKKAQASAQLPITSIKGTQFFPDVDGLLLLYNKEQIMLVDGSTFKNINGNQLKLKITFSKKITEIINDPTDMELAKSSIQCVQFVKGQMQQSLIISLNNDTILEYSIDSHSVTAFTSLRSIFAKKKQKQGQLQGQDFSLCTKDGQKQFVTVMINIKQQSRIILGTNQGRVFSLSSITLKLQNHYLFKDGSKSSQQLNIQSVKKLYKSQNRLFSIHDSYIIEYNTKLSQCIGIYPFKIESMILHSFSQLDKDSLVLTGQFPKLQVIQKKNNEKKQKRISLQLSNRFGTVVKKISKMIAVGGSQGCIDIFWQHMHLMILIP